MVAPSPDDLPLPGLDKKVAFLRDPVHYPHRPAEIDPIETHMSWVFRAGDQVYKMKKPIRYGPLDFSTLEKRALFCAEEVRLNRRFAPEVYRRMVPLRLRDGALALAGTAESEGPAVEWLVHMRRLPERYFLDRMIAEGTVEEPDLRRAGGALSEFYRRAEPVTMSPGEYLELLSNHMRRNERELSAVSEALPTELVGRIAGAQRGFVSERADLLRGRVRQDRIVEGHGDLRPQHVCLRPRPRFFDCLEFDRSFRLLDPVDEIAYLTMECDRRKAYRVGEIFYSEYVDRTGDDVPPALRAFYESHRALVRARLALRHRLAPDGDDPFEWIDRARDYVYLSETCAERFLEGSE